MYAGDLVCDFVCAIGPEARDAIPILIRALQRSGVDRFYAARALVRIGPDARAAAPVLAELLLKGPVQEHATPAWGEALDAFGGPEATQVQVELTRRLDDPNQRIAALQTLGTLRKTAIPAIPKIVEQTQSDDFETLRNAFNALSNLRADARDAVPALLAHLQCKDPRKQYRAACTLGEIGVEAAAAIPRLVELTRSDDKDVRHAAVVVLGEVGGNTPDMPERLSEYLRDPDTQFDAIRALTMLGPAARRAAPALQRIWRDPLNSYRWQAGELLFKLDPALLRAKAGR